MKTRNLVLLLGLMLAVLLFLSACATTECSRTGQVIWEKGFNPKRDAPAWTGKTKSALKEVGISARQVPKKFVVLVGESEDLNNEKGARAGAIDDMLLKYGGYLKMYLDPLLKQAAVNAGVKLPPVDTEIGAYNTVRYIPGQGYDTDLVKAVWMARGKRCLEVGEEPVYRAYVIGVMDEDNRRAHILDAGKETFKTALIPGDKKRQVLDELDKLVAKYKF